MNFHKPDFHPVNVHLGGTCCPDPHGHDRCSSCAVRPHSICAALDPDELQELDALAQPLNFTAKHTLFVEGEPAASLYNVTQGVVRLYKMLEDGRRQIVGFALPGDFIGLSLGESHTFSADTVSNTGVCRFSRTALQGLVERKPHLLRKLLEFSSRELESAQEQMKLLGRRTADERIAAFLIAMRDRWAMLNGQSATVPLPMSRLDIADFLGLTIETVSRGFTRLAREKKILNVPEGVRLMDIRSLETLAAA